MHIKKFLSFISGHKLTALLLAIFGTLGALFLTDLYSTWKSTLLEFINEQKLWSQIEPAENDELLILVFTFDKSKQNTNRFPESAIKESLIQELDKYKNINSRVELVEIPFNENSTSDLEKLRSKNPLVAIYGYEEPSITKISLLSRYYPLSDVPFHFYSDKQKTSLIPKEYNSLISNDLPEIAAVFSLLTVADHYMLNGDLNKSLSLLEEFILKTLHGNHGNLKHAIKSISLSDPDSSFTFIRLDDALSYAESIPVRLQKLYSHIFLKHYATQQMFTEGQGDISAGVNSLFIASILDREHLWLRMIYITRRRFPDEETTGLLKDFTDRYPEDPVTWQALGEWQKSRGNIKESKKAYLKCIDTISNRTFASNEVEQFRARMMEASCYIGLGEYDKWEVFAKEIEEKYEFVKDEMRYHHTFILLQQNELKEAEKLVQIINKEKLNPYRYSSLLNTLATSFRNNEDYDTAENYYLQAIHTNPQSSWALLNLAGLYLQNEEYEKALEYSNKSLNISTIPSAQHIRIAALNRLERYKEAIVYGNEILLFIDANKGYYEDSLKELFLSERVYSYRSSKKYKKALTDVDTLLEINPQNTNALYEKALCHYEQNNYNKTSAILKEIFLIDRKHSYALKLEKLTSTKLSNYNKKRINEGD